VVGAIFYSHIDMWWVAPTMYQCVNKIWHSPLMNVWIKYGTHHVSMCEQNMAPTTYQCVNKIWHPHVVGAIFYSHIDTWWVPYFIHTLIHGGCHILFTHWYVVGAIFCSRIDKWWVPYFIHTLNMAPTTYQCVNKIWHPPLINVRTKFGTHLVSMCE
jgi:hypothetical protein